MTSADAGVGGSSCRVEAGVGGVIWAKIFKEGFNSFRIGGVWGNEELM